MGQRAARPSEGWEKVGAIRVWMPPERAGSLSWPPAGQCQVSLAFVKDHSNGKGSGRTAVFGKVVGLST